MKSNENIICISSIDWDFIWQGHQEIMSTLAKNGNHVLFIENTGVRTPGIKDIKRITNRLKNWFLGIRGIREEKENLYIFSPIVLPFPYLRIARWINRYLILSILDRWVKNMRFFNPIIWVFLPTPLSLDIINNLNSKLVVYYCIDNFRVSSVVAKKIEKSEIKLLKYANLVFVTSRELYAYCSQFSDKVHIFPFGVNYQEFEQVKLNDLSIPDELKYIKKPVIGYIGGVHKWLDMGLIKETALECPEYSFVFIGPLQSDVSLVDKLKNVYFLGKKDHKTMPAFINNFDVCIIPYLLTDYTKNVYPTKLNEYLAMGKPVVSADLLEVRYFNKENNNIVFIGKTPKEFRDCLSNALDSNNENSISERINTARKNSWSSRIEQMSGLLEKTINESQPPDWKRQFLKIYRTSKKNGIKISAIIISLYLFIFYTPLVWMMAEPLKISNAPEKADCIVVFAGGVGESGKPGQGYEERVGYAGELYKKGYAGHLLFSSGYTYVFHEPIIMKLLAVSLGVHEEAIILETKAKNTYENVKFTKEIMDKRGWKKALLISSPYHMGRVSLVVKKNASQITFIYMPSESRFYSRDTATRKVISKRINLRQIKGIVHEYMGILYYWWKRYI